MSDRETIYALAFVVVAMAGVIAKMATHFRDQAAKAEAERELCEDAKIELLKAWRTSDQERERAHQGELRAVLDRQHDALVHVTRTLDALAGDGGANG